MEGFFVKDVQLSKVAERVGVSLATVSKAINHCPGLGGELRERILTAADSAGLRGKPVGECDVYVIMPENPSYFWGTLRKELYERLLERGLSVKLNIYSRLGDDTIVERYLGEAEALGARVVIVAAKTKSLESRLTSLADGRLVISLCEESTARGVFFVGSDRVADGRMLGEHCAADHTELSRILVVGDDSERLRGVREALGARELRVLVPERDVTPSELARRLESLSREFGFGAVICLDGFTSLVCMALKKCFPGMPCYSFERQPLEPRYGLPHGEVVQSLPELARSCADYASRYVRLRTYPDTKRTVVASQYNIRKEITQ